MKSGCEYVRGGQLHMSHLRQNHRQLYDKALIIAYLSKSIMYIVTECNSLLARYAISYYSIGYYSIGYYYFVTFSY